MNWHGCSVRGRWYCWGVLVFGVAPAPAIFCKVTDVFRDFFRTMRIRCVSHVDDFVFVWSSEEEGRRGMCFVRSVFEEAGVLLNNNKSIWSPQQQVEYLGLLWDGSRGTVGIPMRLRAALLDTAYGTQRKTLRAWGRFLGIAGWWRNVFAGTYALLAGFTHLLGVKSRFGWQRMYLWWGARRLVLELIRRSKRKWRVVSTSPVFSDSSEKGGGWCGFPWCVISMEEIS